MTEPLFIHSRDNALVKDLKRLAQDSGAYRKQGRIWVEGDHLCRAALARGRRPALAVLSASFWPLAPVEYAQAAIKTIVIDDALMHHISGLPSPAPLAFVLDWPGALALAADAPTVVLDRVQDAGNVGSILRSAAAAGITQVYCSAGTAFCWSPKVLRAAMGAHFVLDIFENVDLAALVASSNVATLATSGYATQRLYDVDLRQPVAWLFGHEGQGVADDLLSMATHQVVIPHLGQIESLNVAACAAVCFFEQVRQGQA